MVRSVGERAEVRDHVDQGTKSSLLCSLVVVFTICSMLSLSPVLALAEGEGEEAPTEEYVQEQPTSQTVEVDLNDEGLDEISGKLDQIISKVDENTTAVYRLIDNLQHPVEEKEEKVEEEPEEENKTTPELLELQTISSQIDTLLLQNDEPEIQEQRSLAASPRVAYVTYGNVSPTNQYAMYAKQTVAKMGWNDEYVFLQDTSSSYVLIWGALELADSNTITGTGCRYCRWYYANQQQGYQLDKGSADVSVTLQGYTVLSTLGMYPTLDDGTSLLRNEVGFYACVAAVFALLHSVFGFVLRNRNGTTD